MIFSSANTRFNSFCFLPLFALCGALQAAVVTVDADVIRDKIKGGWVGQVVGCTYGGPTEFGWLGTWVQDYVPIRWDENLMLEYYENSPGLYDDIYMDLAFLAVLDKKGVDAPVSEMALKYANAGFRLWHANQAGRWNILNGIMPPQSGYWKNNPHADDIDFQIESDFIGLINPGMPATALEYALKVGHIMNYGDGVYGGVFVQCTPTRSWKTTLSPWCKKLFRACPLRANTTSVSAMFSPGGTSGRTSGNAHGSRCRKNGRPMSAAPTAHSILST